jgi:hypothetical protein
MVNYYSTPTITIPFVEMIIINYVGKYSTILVNIQLTSLTPPSSIEVSVLNQKYERPCIHVC